MQNFDAAKPSSGIGVLPPPLRVAFTEACAERQVCAYRQFEKRRGRPSPNALDLALQEVWAHSDQPPDFKRQAESELGAGTAYLEIINGWPSRQVEVYGTTWQWGDEAHPEHLADQPLDVLELGEEHEISSAEFERMWREALERCRPHS